MISKRLRAAGNMFNDLIRCMHHDKISTESKIINLREELAKHYGDKRFHDCNTMGSMVGTSLQVIIEKVSSKK